MTSDRTDVSVAFDSIRHAILSDIRTCMPGQIVSFDRDNQTATIQPCLKRRIKGRVDPIAYPPVEDVPVVFFGSGDYWITVDLKADSYVLLCASERSIATWLDQGGIQDPTVKHKFDISDVFAIPGPNPNPTALSTVTADALELRTRDNNVVLRIEDDKVTIETPKVVINNEVDAAALATKVDLLWSTLDTVLRTAWVVAPSDGGAALKAAYLAAFAAPPTSVASTKLKLDS